MALHLIPDDGLVPILSYLSASTLGQVTRVSVDLAAVARADALWLPLARDRWRFGALLSDAVAVNDELVPGVRDEKATTMLEGIQLSSGVNSRMGVYAHYASRCRQDAEVAELVVQLIAIAKPSVCIQDYPSDETVQIGSLTGVPQYDISSGALVQICGLTGAPQYNGRRGIVLSAPPLEDSIVECDDVPCRFCVALPPSMRLLTVRRQNISIESPAPTTGGIVEKRILNFGADVIDELGRLSSILPDRLSPLESETRVVSENLLAKATERWAVAMWSRLVADEDRLNLLEEGSLVVSQWASPLGTSTRSVRNELGRLSERVATLVSPDAPLADRVKAVSNVLFLENDFKGNAQDYYNPCNSLLHEVLQNRTGIPISLSIVWVVVARRVDIPCFLCSHMPAHIVIRVLSDPSEENLGSDLFVDAFHQQILDFEGLQDFTARLGVPFSEKYVRRRPAACVYVRLFRNLLCIYKNIASTSDGLARLSALRKYAAIHAQALAISSCDGEPSRMEGTAKFTDDVIEELSNRLIRGNLPARHS